MIFQDMYKKDDEYYTPRYAVKPLLKYLKPQSKIWCPFDTAESEFVKVLTEADHEVIHTHISEDGDYFTLAPPQQTTSSAIRLSALVKRYLKGCTKSAYRLPCC